MLKSKYFTEYEMTDSITATLNNIDNTPTEEHRENLKELMEVLDTIREKWGGPIRITSGYRCEELNKKLGGSKTSVHPLALAADMKPYNNKIDEFFKCVEEWAKDEKNTWDQIIWETDKSGNRWCHFGWKNAKGQQRKQIKSMTKK
jgi:hypothetical protein